MKHSEKALYLMKEMGDTKQEIFPKRNTIQHKKSQCLPWPNDHAGVGSE